MARICIATIGMLLIVWPAFGQANRSEVARIDKGTQSQSNIMFADTVSVTLAVDERFVDARSISVDPSGRVYVVDAARNTVSVFDKDGDLVGTFGGIGTNAGQFDEPADLDPTNGLILNVADTGNGRIQRFSKDLRFLESLPVPTSVDANLDNTPSFRPGAERVQAPSDGRPIAVATSRADDLYVIEESTNSVIRWDRDRRSPRLIGRGPDDSEVLRKPIDLAVVGDRLFVADGELNTVVVFDLFGGFQKRLELQQEDEIVAISTSPAAIAAVFRTSVSIFNHDGSMIAKIVPSIPGGEALVDAVYTVDSTAINSTDVTLYLLTRQHLYSVTFLPGSFN